MATVNSPKQNKWDLIVGLFLIGLGSFRMYNYFINGTAYSTLRLVLTIAFIGYGVFNIYKYVKAGQA